MLLFLLVLLVPSLMGQNCSEQCCYWNITAPGNYSDCHVSHNGTVVLTCEVYAPRDSNKNSLATVKWYRRIESVVEDITDRYENSTMQINFSNTSINGLFEDRYQLIIRSINSSNNSGVYWCQLSADRFCFIPSVYVNITVNTSLNGSDCSEFKYHQSQVCAVDNSSSCQVISTSSINTMSSTPPVMTSQLNLCHGKLELKNLGFAACLGVTVPAAGFTLILMIILICCAGICICWRKKTRRKVAQSVTHTEMDHTSDRYNAQVVSLKRRKVHQYEDVENPQPDEHTAEPVSDCERTLTDGDKMVEHEYNELEHIHQADTDVLQTTDLEGDQGEPHTYEIILAVGQDKDKTAVNTKQQLQIESSQYYYEDVCDNKLSKQPQSSFDSFSTSHSSQNQYNVLDHSLVSNPGQKATIKAEDSMEDHRYSRIHAHKLTLMGNSVEETSQDNQYENLGSVVKTAQQQNILANESSGSCEYHILAEAVSNGTTIPTTSNDPEQTPPIPKRKSNTTVPADGALNYNESSQQNIKIQEQLLDESRSEESKERVFDDPQYGIFPTAPKVLEDKLEHRKEAA